MSELKLKCPHCGATVTTPKTNYGKQIECLSCRGQVIVPPKPQGAKIAEIIDDEDPAPKPKAQSAEAEETIFEVSPLKRGFLKEWILGILLFVVLVGIYFLIKIWIQTKYTVYRLTTERFLLRKGFISRRHEEIEIFRIKDVSATQSFWERIFGVGTVTIWSTDDSTPKLELVGLRNPVKIKEDIRRESRRARKREGIRGAEFIQS